MLLLQVILGARFHLLNGRAGRVSDHCVADCFGVRVVCGGRVRHRHRAGMLSLQHARAVLLLYIAWIGSSVVALEIEGNKSKIKKNSNYMLNCFFFLCVH